MRQRRPVSLMLQLLLFFSLIMVAVCLLIATSWASRRWEDRANDDFNALTAPYTQLYAGLGELSGSTGRIGHPGWGQEEFAEIAEAVRDASERLKELLNREAFDRASIDLNNTMSRYLGTYRAVLDSYDAQDYTGVNAHLEALQRTELWLRTYLKRCDETISQRRDSLLAEQRRGRIHFNRILLSLGVLVLILCALTLLRTARSAVLPIQQLCKNVSQFRLTDSLEKLKERGVPCKSSSIREIRTLGTAIYSMENAVLDQYAVEKSNELLSARLSQEELHTAKVEKQLRETQLRALQAQINPHFLFNTLNMIAQMSYLEGAGHTTELLETFSDYFRYNVENFERSVTLAEELANVRGYVSLQRERFGERIAYEIEFDEAAGGIRVPCLIIQPFVENAIVHGLRRKLEGGRVNIAVRATPGGGFEIRVADNGCGMEPEAIEALVRRAEADEDSESGSIGISNVIRRLKIAFGEGVSFGAKGAPGAGLEISVRVERGSTGAIEATDRGR